MPRKTRPRAGSRYESGSFDRAECELDEQGRCAVIDRLLGSRLLVAKAELRFPLFGVFGARNLYGPVPIELALFADAGAAWSRGQSPSLFGGDRGFVSSVGLAARLNVLGAFIVETAFVKPLDRPRKGWSWQFSFVPGF